MTRRSLNRRLPGLILGILVILILTLDSVGAQDGIPRVSTQEKITLVWAVPGNPQEVAVYQKLAENFMKANPNVTVRVDREASSYTKTLTLIAGGNAPDILFF
ncbi:MAG: hypothetical protein AB1700_12665, partial [Bacillota bacterium]